MDLKDGRKVWKVDKHDLLTHQKEKTCSRLRPNGFFRSLKKKSNFRAKIRHCCSRDFGFAIFLPRVNARRKTQSKISRATMSNFGSQVRFFSFSTRSKKTRIRPSSWWSKNHAWMTFIFIILSINRICIFITFISLIIHQYLYLDISLSPNV